MFHDFSKMQAKSKIHANYLIGEDHRRTQKNVSAIPCFLFTLIKQQKNCSQSKQNSLFQISQTFFALLHVYRSRRVSDVVMASNLVLLFTKYNA